MRVLSIVPERLTETGPLALDWSGGEEASTRAGGFWSSPGQSSVQLTTRQTAPTRCNEEIG